MISREDFAFTIGYDGPMAVVDKQARTQYGSLSPSELAEKGFFRAAFSKALYDADESGIKAVMEAYNKRGGTAYTKAEELSRLFGVYPEKPLRSKKL